MSRRGRELARVATRFDLRQSLSSEENAHNGACCARRKSVFLICLAPRYVALCAPEKIVTPACLAAFFSRSSNVASGAPCRIESSR